MKDIFELLNEIDVEDTDMIEMEVTDIEKQKVKDYIKTSLKNKNRYKKFRIAVVAVTVCLTLTATVVGISIINPTYAANIPIVRDIFKFLDRGQNGIYDKFKDNANEINTIKKDSGVEIKITDAIFDSMTVYYTYEIKTDEDLGDELIISNEYLDIKGINGQGGSSQIKKIAPKTYIGQSSRTLDKEMDKVKCKLSFKDINYRQDINEEFKVLKGKWNFDFELDAISTDKHIINKSIVQDGIKINIESITDTAISSIIKYTLEIVDNNDFTKSITDESGWIKGSAEITATDDCGNVYDEFSTSGGHGEKGVMTYIQSFNTIDKNANKLIVTPKILFGSGGGGVSIDENGNEVYTEYTNKIDDIVFDSIEIELNK